MKKALWLALALVTVAPVAVEAQQRLAELVRQGDTYLKRSLVLRRLTPYTGEVIEYYGSREKSSLTKVWNQLQLATLDSSTGRNRIELAKITGITPDWLTLRGM